MKAYRNDEKVIVELTPQEAHVVIWGGRTDAVERVQHNLRHHLVNVEDKEFTDDEYRNLFDDLDAMYEDLSNDPPVYAEKE